MATLFDIREVDPEIKKAEEKKQKASASKKTVKSRASLGKQLQRVEDVIGILSPGESIHYASCGEWSTHDLIEHILNQIGPAHLIFATWSVSEDAIRKLIAWQKEDRLLSMKALLDWRVKVRRPEVLALLKYNLQKTDLYLSSCHAKVAVLKNDEWSVSIVGSANFTNNPRIEAGVIAVDHSITEFHSSWIEEEIRRSSPFKSDSNQEEK